MCVFHVSLLKPYYNDGLSLSPPPPEVLNDEPEWEVDRTLDHRVIKHKKTSKVEYLIRFSGYGLSMMFGKMMYNAMLCNNTIQCYA